MIRSLLAVSLFTLAAAPALAEDTTLDCLANPAQKVTIGSSATGVVAQTLVSRGDHVTKGEIIGRLDSTIEEADVAVAQAQAEGTELQEAQQAKLDVATANVERAKALLASGSVNQSQLEQLQALAAVARSDLATETRRLALAKIELDRANAVLSLRTIKSPIDGFVVSVDTRPGEFLRQDSTLMTLVETDPLYIEAYAPVELFGRIKLGDAGTVALDQPAGTSVAAKVTVVDPVFDAASATFGIRLDLPNPDDKLPAGQRCSVTMTLADK